jgi:CRISPR system Cascade subunit CasE
MMLSRLVLHPLHREVAAAVRDAQRLHQMVQLGFGPAGAAGPRAAHEILYRLEVDSGTGGLVLLVQSPAAPDWSLLPPGLLAAVDGPNPASRSLEPMLRELAVGMRLRFRLRANVTRKIKTKSVDGTRCNGTRVPLRSDEARVAWLARKGAAAGFALAPSDQGVPDLVIGREDTVRGTHGRLPLTFEAVRFDGRLRITDVERFRAALRAGIGPAKAYGFGLLSLAPG